MFLPAKKQKIKKLLKLNNYFNKSIGTAYKCLKQFDLSLQFYLEANSILNN